MGENLPYWAQWFGLIATVAGTGLSLGSLIWAILAARRAKTASEAATRAWHAAMQLARLAQLDDLLAELQELQSMLARGDFQAIAAKCTQLRGRLVRFEQETYSGLREDEKSAINEARDQLEIVTAVAVAGRGQPANRIGKIQLGCAKANEALNRLLAMSRAKVRGGH